MKRLEEERKELEGIESKVRNGIGIRSESWVKEEKEKKMKKTQPRVLHIVIVTELYVNRLQP